MKVTENPPEFGGCFGGNRLLRRPACPAFSPGRVGAQSVAPEAASQKPEVTSVGGGPQSPCAVRGTTLKMANPDSIPHFQSATPTPRRSLGIPAGLVGPSIDFRISGEPPASPRSCAPALVLSFPLTGAPATGSMLPALPSLGTPKFPALQRPAWRPLLLQLLPGGGHPLRPPLSRSPAKALPLPAPPHGALA